MALNRSPESIEQMEPSCKHDLGVFDDMIAVKQSRVASITDE